MSLRLETKSNFVPQKDPLFQFIFGELRAGSNFDDEKRIVGGRNGMGATLCNIYSDFFEVETASKGKYFKMAWKNGTPVEGSRKRSSFLAK